MPEIPQFPAWEKGPGSKDPFPDGIYFVPLAPLSAPEQLVAALTSQLGLHLSATDPWSELLDHLREKRLLLVLDNFEHLLDSTGRGARLLADILAAGRQVQILVTSRERLNLTGEAVYTLAGMTIPEDAAPARVRCRTADPSGRSC